MDVIDLKSREVFSHEGRGVAALVEEPNLKIRQVGLEPGKEVPVHTADAPVTLQVVRGEGVFSAGERERPDGAGETPPDPGGCVDGNPERIDEAPGFSRDQDTAGGRVRSGTPSWPGSRGRSSI